MAIRNKTVLITAGPSWVAIDEVRVISNIAGAETGIALAKNLSAGGAKVTLIINCPGLEGSSLRKNVRILRFRYFDELKKLLTKTLRKKFDFIIHSAAVSDYQLKSPLTGKIKSGKDISLRLKPTLKLTELIRRCKKKAKFIVFKLELSVTKEQLINRAAKLMAVCDADLAIANTFRNKQYRAFIVDRAKNILSRASSKKDLVAKLTERLTI